MPNFVRVTREKETIYIPISNIAAVSERSDGGYTVFLRDHARNVTSLKIDADATADIELLKKFVTADVRA